MMRGHSDRDVAPSDRRARVAPEVFAMARTLLPARTMREGASADPRSAGAQAEADRDGVVLAARAVVVALGLVAFGLFAWVVGSRFAYRVDGEWMVGAVREGVRRLRDGQPMYLAPNETFIPFVYPPLYHVTSAYLARFVSVFVACKLVSLGATTTLGWAIVRVSRALGATRFWALSGALLHVGAYSMTSMFYDLERVDAFATAIVATALVVLLTGESRARTAVGGVLLGLAFFAKQPNVLTLLSATVGLVAAGRRARAIQIFAIGAATFVAAFAYLEITTDGWFRHYCVTVPGKHGLDLRVLSTFCIVDMPRGFVLSAATLAVGVPTIASLVTKRRPSANATWREVLFATVAMTAMLEAFFLRAHRGGWSNVILAWTPFGCMATSIVASKLEARARGTPLARAVSLTLLAGIGLQLLGGFFDPLDYGPNAEDLAERGRLVAFVHDLERRGDVVVTTTGDLTTRRHFQIGALYDLLRSGDKLPRDIAAAFRERRYAAIVVGTPIELQCEITGDEEAFDLLISNYFIAGRREERGRSGMSGHDTRPRWVLLPRKHPLFGVRKAALEDRMQAEMGLAEAQMRARPAGTEPVLDEAIEDLALSALRWEAIGATRE
jgi:hypothetical protein